MLAACARRNSRQLGPLCRGAGPSLARASRREERLHHVASYVKYRRPRSPSATISPGFDPLDAGDGLSVTSLEPLAVCPLAAVARAVVSGSRELARDAYLPADPGRIPVRDRDHSLISRERKRRGDRVLVRDVPTGVTGNRSRGLRGAQLPVGVAFGVPASQTDNLLGAGAILGL